MNADVSPRFHTNILLNRFNINLSVTVMLVTLTLNFNHPVKELVWAGATDSTSGVRSTFDNSASTNVLLKLNGHDRFSGRPMTYFTQTQVWQHHTGTPK